MKPLIPALFLSAAVPALGQTFQRPYQFQVPPPQQSPRILPQPRVFPFDKSVPAPGFTLPTPAPQFTNPTLDEHIVRRPPKGSFTAQQPRTPLAANLYPGLKILPTETASPKETASMEPIPVYFPRFKMEPIPTIWPDRKMIPIQRATPTPGQKK